MISYAV